MPMPKMTIEEFKEAYPQYQNEPSEILAKNLYDKFYSDVPYKSYLETVMPEPEDDNFFKLTEGRDYAKVFGPGDATSRAILGVVEGGADLLLNKNLNFKPAEREAVADIKAFNTYATTRLMQTLAGKENVQLQERLQDLTANPKFFQTPASAAATVRAYLGFLDFSEDSTKNLMSSGLLDKKDTIKARQDLKAIQSMREEYTKLSKQFERAAGKTVDTENKLERFYRD